jgi:Phosphomannomutase
LSKISATSAEVFAQFPEQISTPELSVAVTDETKFSIMHDLFNTVVFSQPHKIIAIDGMRVEFPGGWGLVRPSNTTPKLVVRFEAKTIDLLNDIKAQFRAALLHVDPKLVLPF